MSMNDQTTAAPDPHRFSRLFSKANKTGMANETGDTKLVTPFGAFTDPKERGVHFTDQIQELPTADDAIQFMETDARVRHLPLLTRAIAVFDQSDKEIEGLESQAKKNADRLQATPLTVTDPKGKHELTRSQIAVLAGLCIAVFAFWIGASAYTLGIAAKASFFLGFWEKACVPLAVAGAAVLIDMTYVKCRSAGKDVLQFALSGIGLVMLIIFLVAMTGDAATATGLQASADATSLQPAASADWDDAGWGSGASQDASDGQAKAVLELISFSIFEICVSASLVIVITKYVGSIDRQEVPNRARKALQGQHDSDQAKLDDLIWQRAEAASVREMFPEYVKESGQIGGVIWHRKDKATN